MINNIFRAEKEQKERDAAEKRRKQREEERLQRQAEEAERAAKRKALASDTQSQEDEVNAMPVVQEKEPEKQYRKF